VLDAHVMQKLTSLFASLMLVAAVGCADDDGGSGLDDSRRVSSLSDAETMQLCADLTTQIGDRTVSCDDGTTLTIGASDECVDDLTAVHSLPDCTTTVGQYQACVEAMNDQSDAQLCSFELPAACAPVFQAACFPQQ
jgi:hypothetical protein